ncbi:MAG: SufD family Fe-S cluster assembly protein [Clostridiales bacterium]|jgi:Fe-S cluster assembly scaffold protein SufB|nr:SufD family Fe-S cluster assembly protein [Clostridiales bacterium]
MEKAELSKMESKLLMAIADIPGITPGAFSLRKNGKPVYVNTTPNINIIKKEDKPGIDIYIRADTKDEEVHIPVVITESGISDTVYNDFYVGKNADVVINAGCGIHNDGCTDTHHNGIHRFFLDEGAKVKYVEKHYGEGSGDGKRVLDPVTEVTLGKNATLEMYTTQIKGVDSTVRNTEAKLDDNSTLLVSEKIMTHGVQHAETNFSVNLDGKGSSCQVTSRSVATESSTQKFVSEIYGNNECFGHVECDAIIKENGKVVSTPAIVANCLDANLIHEAAIGKIAGAQITKLMTLGLTEKEAEDAIINGFLQ